jgi:hypothetical protein
MIFCSFASVSSISFLWRQLFCLRFSTCRSALLPESYRSRILLSGNFINDGFRVKLLKRVAANVRAALPE